MVTLHVRLSSPLGAVQAPAESGRGGGASKAIFARCAAWGQGGNYPAASGFLAWLGVG